MDRSLEGNWSRSVELTGDDSGLNARPCAHYRRAFQGKTMNTASERQRRKLLVAIEASALSMLKRCTFCGYTVIGDDALL